MQLSAFRPFFVRLCWKRLRLYGVHMTWHLRQTTEKWMRCYINASMRCKSSNLMSQTSDVFLSQVYWVEIFKEEKVFLIFSCSIWTNCVLWDKQTFWPGSVCDRAVVQWGWAQARLKKERAGVLLWLGCYIHPKHFPPLPQPIWPKGSSVYSWGKLRDTKMKE